MAYFVYLLAAIGATGNLESVQVLPPPPATPNNPYPTPRGNPGNWVNMNDYPTAALQKEIEGTTGFSVTVGPDGRVSDCVITMSSGSAELDGATCSNVARRARFTPALDSSGNPISGKYANRIRWQIPSFVPQISFPSSPVMQDSSWTRIMPTDFPQKALAEKRQGKAKIELAISPAGIVDSCKILTSSTHADLDAESCKIATNKAKFGPALDVNGQPTAGRVQTQLVWRIVGAGNGVPVPSAAGKPTVLAKEFRPKPGVSIMSFTVSADGNLTDCSGQSNMDASVFVPEAMCNAKIRFEPYTDANGMPVARRVITTMKVEFVDPK